MAVGFVMAVALARDQRDAVPIRRSPATLQPPPPHYPPSAPQRRYPGIIGVDVFTGKMLKGRVVLTNKKAWAARFKKYAVLAGVNEPQKSCHRVRKARAEVAAYADCTESQMMAMFGWTDPKMPAHYIAKANREKLGLTGMDKPVSFDSAKTRTSTTSCRCGP
jgi:hypothetical protein